MYDEEKRKDLARRTLKIIEDDAQGRKKQDDRELIHLLWSIYYELA